MHVIFVFFGVILILVEFIGGILSIISICILSGYFLARVVLKILGLHSGSPEQVRNELKFAAICGMIILVTIASRLIVAFLAPD